MSLHVKLEHVIGEWLSYDATAKCDGCGKDIPVRMVFSEEFISNNRDPETHVMLKIEAQIETLDLNKYYFHDEKLMCARCHEFCNEVNKHALSDFS
jgi:hypothetical protein